MLRRLPIELQNYVFDFIKYEKSKTLDMELNEYFYYKNKKKIEECVHKKITDIIDSSLYDDFEFQYSFEYRQWRFRPEFEFVDWYYKVNITAYFLYVEIDMLIDDEEIKSTSKIYFKMDDENDDDDIYDIMPLEIGRFTHLNFQMIREILEEDIF